MDKITLDAGTLLCPVPVVMVSCGRGEEKNIITIAWTGIINSKPPMTYISVRKSRHSHDILYREREFVINLTTRQLALATDWCGVKSGDNYDKFREMGLTPVDCQEVKCPMIGEAPVNLECKVKEIREYPSHDMFVAEIVRIHVDKNLVDENGKIEADKAGLIAYIHGEYFGINKMPIGKFGFSVMRSKTRKRINRENHLKRIEANRRTRTAHRHGKKTDSSLRRKK